MRWKVGVLGESLSSWQRPQQPYHDCSLACVGGEGSEVAEGGGCDDDGDENCSQLVGDRLDYFDHTESVGLPIFGPAGILWDLHPGGRSYVVCFLSLLTSAAVGGKASLHLGQGSCCNFPVHQCSDVHDGCFPVPQLECQLKVASDWMSHC